MENNENNGYIRDVYNTTQQKYFERNEPPLFKTNNTQPLRGILEETTLSNLFFSDMNKEAIQKTIRYEIYKTLNKEISYQSDISLMIIMRSMYLQFANSVVHSDDIIETVRGLNKRVVEYSVDNIKPQLEQHDGYMEKISNAPVPLEHPAYVNKQNFTYDISNLR